MPTRILGSPSMAIEAFSENGLYSSRGMQAMKEYKTVKEVCALTGLTRKHLYYFHHENVVQAAAYANYSVEGNDGVMAAPTVGAILADILPYLGVKKMEEPQ